MFTEEDIKQFSEKGIDEKTVERQLDLFKTGFPFKKLYAAASAEKGVSKYSESQRAAYVDVWNEYSKNDEVKLVKFVPASGAASRMFKNMFAFLDAEYEEPKTDFEKKFFGSISHFAFYDALDSVCRKLYGKEIPELQKAGRYKEIVAAMLGEQGLNYGKKPKGLLLFHSYDDGARTPVEEHLYEGKLIAAKENGEVNLHFTISLEHRVLFETLLAEKVPDIEKKTGCKFNIGLSEQKPKTDTVAATPDNKPFRKADGSILFRPGGHGALIENLNDIDADVIFVKNIDNIVPERLMEDTVNYKKLLAGKLVSVQKQLFAYLEELESGMPDDETLKEMKNYLETELCTIRPGVKFESNLELADYLFCKFNRPLRVCGMVRNVGEAGGGPFLVFNNDGSISPQILESSQIDTSDEKSKKMFENGSYFNPVDLVCGVKDYNGNKFDLRDYVDATAGFISHKSKDGKELKALELPGLWNGGMSDWNTVFVEVPLSTFNPVKTVNDLLRLQHQ